MRTTATLLPLLLLASMPLHAQRSYDPRQAMAEQKAAMARMPAMQGTWRGPAWAIDYKGVRREMIQTERVGSMLDGTVKVIEGRGYLPDGTLGFNAFAIVSYDVDKKAYSIRSYAMGRASDFAFTPTPDGFTWEIPHGPKARVVYRAVIKDDTFHEYGERLVEGQPPVRIMEMTLKRVGDTDWPAGNPVLPK